MANANAPFGFRPYIADSPTYGTIRCVIPASDGTATFIGDAVKLHGDSDTGYATVIQAAAGDPVYGVVVAFEASPATSLSDQYRKASTKRFCQVALASQWTFLVQSDDDTTALATTDVGLNANFIVAAGSTVTGLSGMELNSDGANTTNSLDLQIMGLLDQEDNLLSGTGSDNKIVIVRFNDPQTKYVRTGV
jgi:hypothetical protein